MLYRTHFVSDQFLPPTPGGRPAEPLDGPPAWEDTFFEIGIALAALLGLAVAAAGLASQAGI